MRLFNAIILGAALIGLPAHAQMKTLKLAIFELEPLMMKDPNTNQAGGAVVDYWKNFVGPKMGYAIEVAGPHPVKRVEAMLEAGEIDVAPLFTKIPSREALFQYPETHLAEIISCLMVLPNSPIKEVTKQEDLFKKRIGFLEGGFIPPFVKHPSITLELVAQQDYRQVNINKLTAGRIDAVLDINYLSLMYYLKQRNLTQQIRVIMLPIEKGKVFSIFRKTPEGTRLREEYDRINKEGLAAGVFEKMAQKYLK